MINNSQGLPHQASMTANSAKEFPQVPEQSAIGRVATLYADIRQVTRVPLVNLIYRHLATDPAALEWAWEALRPHHVSGALRHQAQALRNGADEVTASWSVSRSGWNTGFADAAVLVNSYIVGNCVNLVSLAHLLRPQNNGKPIALDDGVADALEEVRRLPGIPQMQDLDEATIARIHRLDGYGETGQPEVRPSLYRHLSLWPDALLRADEFLTPLEQRGALLQACNDVSAIAAGIAVAEPLNTPVRNAALSPFLPRIEHFANVTIPKMIPICAALLGLYCKRVPEAPRTFQGNLSR